MPIQFTDTSDISVKMNKLWPGNLTQWTKESLYRLYIPELFSQYEKVLYCDCDIVFLADPALLFDINLTDKLFAAAEDIDITVYSKERRKFMEEILKIKPEQYVNAGVILFNNNLAREENFTKNAWLFLEKTKNLKFPDQDTLNHFGRGRIHYLDPAWNTQLHAIIFHNNITKSWTEIFKNPKIIHYTSLHKPWNGFFSKESMHFWQYLSKTDFFDGIFYNGELGDTKQALKLHNKTACIFYFYHILYLLMPKCGFKNNIKQKRQHYKTKVSFGRELKKILKIINKPSVIKK